MKSRTVLAAAVAGLLAGVIPALTVQAAPITLFNTGVDNNGVLLAPGAVDPHYTLLGTSPAGPTAYVVIPSPGSPFPIPPWFADGPASMWIGPLANEDVFPTAANPGYGGVFDYRTTFDLTGFNPATAVITGGWSTDNHGVDILINGISTGFTTSDTQFLSGLSPF
jgi:hypothetical protein